MTFFYDLNKKLDEIRATPSTTHGQLNERDMSRAAKGYEKYGKEGMEALAKAGREGKDLDPVRNKYDKYDESMEEGIGDMARKVGGAVKQVAGKAMDILGHGSDEDLIRDMQKQAGLPQTGQKPMATYNKQETDEGNAFSKAVVDAKKDGVQPGEKIRVDGKEYPVKEAAKWRDPKYKDKLYTQEPRDYDQYDYGDDDYYNPKPADYPGEKNLKGGDEFSHNDPLQKGQGIGRSGIKHSILDRGPRKGLPSRDQITSLKGSIKSASGTHARPNLPEAGAPMTAKQKSFAALAPPTDKITFADKIAGAKKEVDEMLGDVAAEAMKAALGQGKKIVADEAKDDDNNPFTNYKKPRAEKPKVGSTERGALHDIEHTATGRKVTRRVDPNTGHSVGSDDAPAAGEKRKAGRPSGSKKALGAKGPSGKSKLMTKEGEVSTGNLQKMHQLATGLKMFVQDPEGLALLKELTSLVKHYVSQGGEKELDEKATSKKQQKFMGMVHATQKGEKAPSKEVAKVAKTMKKGDAEDFAATKHKGLPEKKKAKKEEVEETTTSGSVAVGGQAPSDPSAPKKEKASKGSMQFGKGVYEAKIAESFNSKLTNVLNEGMSINMSIDQEGRKNLTVTATDDDAEGLADLLKMAGLGGQGHEACGTCGESSCGCDQVDETLANSADNTEYADTDTMVNTLSGGLNGRKSTGQTTAPIVNRDPSRGSIGPIAKQVQEDAEQRLWAIYNRYSTSNK